MTAWWQVRAAFNASRGFMAEWRAWRHMITCGSMKDPACPSLCDCRSWRIF